MSRKTLADEIQSENMAPEIAAFLNVIRTADLFSIELQRFFKPHHVTLQQFNILRILRGGPEGGIPSLEIGSRMVSCAPDVTRLIDRMEKAGLVTRTRSDEDRRVVRIKITEKGLDLAEQLLEPLTALHREQLAALGSEEVGELSRLLELSRTRQSLIEAH